MPGRGKLKRKRNKPPPVGTFVVVTWVDSGMERHNSEVPPEGAGLATWETPGWLMFWNENDDEPLSDACILNRGKASIGANDLLSIWIPSIISITEYKKAKK